MDPISVFQKAIDQTGNIVSAVRPEQLGESTPCGDWDVRALLNHAIAVVQMFDNAATGKDFEGSFFADDNVGRDPGASYEAVASKLRTSLAQPGVMDGNWSMALWQRSRDHGGRVRHARDRAARLGRGEGHGSTAGVRPGRHRNGVCCGPAGARRIGAHPGRLRP